MSAIIAPPWARAVPALAVLLVCAFQARGLPAIWQADVFAHSGPWLFLFWMLPLLWRWIRERPQSSWPVPDVLLLSAALAAAFLGTLGSLNIARQTALGLALGGQVGWQWTKLLWLAGMLAWLPASGWFAMRLDVDAFWLRLGVLVLSLALSVGWWKGKAR